MIGGYVYAYTLSCIIYVVDINNFEGILIAKMILFAQVMNTKNNIELVIEKKWRLFLT